MSEWNDSFRSPILNMIVDNRRISKNLSGIPSLTQSRVSIPIVPITSLDSLIVKKTADEIRNNTAVQTDDAEFTFTTEANSVYRVTVGIKFYLTDFASTGLAYTLYGTGFTVCLKWQEIVRGGDPYSNTMTYKILYLVTTGLGGDTIKLKWAQTVADPSDSIIRAGSYILYSRLA